ncbi:MAG TPA: DUF5719 family protein [Mycobacteriales bacterium]|nr:DUF5719 family protein [Mycobacteriales bacterium]
MVSSRFAAPVAAGVSLVLVMGAAAATRPKDSHGGGARPTTTGAVLGRTLVCPDAPAQSDTVQTRTVIGTGRLGGGSVSVAPVTAYKTPTAVTLTSTGTGGYADVTQPVDQPLVVTAAGDLAGGLVASRLTRASTGERRGYAWDRCTPPVTDAYFAGVSTGAGVVSTLTLTNADDTPADVDVVGLTVDGEVSPSLTRGYQLGPHTTQKVKLADLAPDQDAMAVEVIATRGRVASSIDELRQGDKPQGVDPVPQQTQAASTLVIAGVPGSADNTLTAPSAYHHTLTIGNPTGRDTTVSVEITDAGQAATKDTPAKPGGRFVPSTAVGGTAGTLAQLLVPAQSVTVVGPKVLDNVLNGSPVTLRIKSDDGTPIVAGAMVQGIEKIGPSQQLCADDPAGCYAETLHLGAGPGVAGPTVLTDLRVGKSLDTVLTLTTFANRPAHVTITTFPPGGPLSVDIPAGEEVQVPLHGLAGHAAGKDQVVQIVPDAGSPPIFAAAFVEELGYNGPLLGGIPVTAGASSVGLPVVQPDITVPLVDARR